MHKSERRTALLAAAVVVVHAGPVGRGSSNGRCNDPLSQADPVPFRVRVRVRFRVGVTVRGFDSH